MDDINVEELLSSMYTDHVLNPVYIDFLLVDPVFGRQLSELLGQLAAGATEASAARLNTLATMLQITSGIAGDQEEGSLLALAEPLEALKTAVEGSRSTNQSNLNRKSCTRNYSRLYSFVIIMLESSGESSGSGTNSGLSDMLGGGSTSGTRGGDPAGMSGISRGAGRGPLGNSNSTSGHASNGSTRSGTSSTIQINAPQPPRPKRRRPDDEEYNLMTACTVPLNPTNTIDKDMVLARLGEHANAVKSMGSAAMIPGRPLSFSHSGTEPEREQLKNIYQQAAEHVVSTNVIKASLNAQCSYTVGATVNKTVRSALPLENAVDSRPAVERGEVFVIEQLAKNCKTLEFQEIMSVLEKCTCQKCLTLKQKWSTIDDDILLYKLGEACHSTEVNMHAVAVKYTGVSKSTLANLSLIAKTYPSDSAFGFGIPGVMQTQLHHDLFQISNSVPMKTRLPLLPHYVIAGGLRSLASMHFVDGDSGYIVLDNIPELLNKYASAGKSVNYSNCSRSETWLPFRDSFHDAVEISHQFIVRGSHIARPEKHDFGLQGFWKALEVIHKAHEIAIFVNDDSAILNNAPNARLHVTIFIRYQPNEMWMPFAVELLKAGLSFVTEIAARSSDISISDYIEAQKLAETNKSGLFSIVSTSAELQNLFPWKIRRINLPMTVDLANTTKITVEYSKANVNQCMVFIAESSIPGAGYGLFLRPSFLPSFASDMYFKKDDILCWYTKTLLPSNTFDSLTNTDYAIEVQVGNRVGIANAEIFDGHNIGRFVNQGGLIDGLKALGEEILSNGTSSKPCEDRAKAKCNLRFSQGTSSTTKSHVCLKVLPEKLTCFANQAIELFVNYSIAQYWIRFFSNIDIRNGINDEEEDELLLLTRWIVAENCRRGEPISLQHCYEDSDLTNIIQQCKEPPIEISVARLRRKK